MTMKSVIGVVGEKGSGKGTFTELLKKICPEPVACVKSSDLLVETLNLWKIPLTRRNLQELAIVMDGAYGEGSLSRAVAERIRNAQERVVVFEGIRWPSDLEMVRSFPGSMVAYVTAPAGIRYERTKKRKEKAGEGDATFEQFMKEEQVATETQIVSIGRSADAKIENLGSKEEFEEKVRGFWEGMG